MPEDRPDPQEEIEPRDGDGESAASAETEGKATEPAEGKAAEATEGKVEKEFDPEHGDGSFLIGGPDADTGFTPNGVTEDKTNPDGQDEWFANEFKRIEAAPRKQVSLGTNPAADLGSGSEAPISEPRGKDEPKPAAGVRKGAERLRRKLDPRNR